jgi:hypothetical protein
LSEKSFGSCSQGYIGNDNGAGFGEEELGEGKVDAGACTGDLET